MLKRSLFLLLLAIAGLSACAQEQESTTIIFTRHAEKQDDGTKDPDLTEKGLERASKIATLLEKVPVSAIYSTDFKRTRNTVKPISEQKEKGML